MREKGREADAHGWNEREENHTQRTHTAFFFISRAEARLLRCNPPPSSEKEEEEEEEERDGESSALCLSLFPSSPPFSLSILIGSLKKYPFCWSEKKVSFFGEKRLAKMRRRRSAVFLGGGCGC